MKRTLACAALVGALGMNALPALDLSVLSFDAKLGYESEYVNHGRKEGQENVQFGLELGADIGGGHLYGGATSVLMFKDSWEQIPLVMGTGEDTAAKAYLLDTTGKASGDAIVNSFEGLPALPWYSSFWSANSISPYVGYTFGAGGLIKADVGYVAHIYTNLRNYRSLLAIEDEPVNIKRNTNEIYGGVHFDILCDPSVYAFYDIEREEFAFVGSGAYSWDLSTLGLTNISLEVKATVGYDYTKRPYGGNFLAVVTPTFNDDSKDYFYYCFEGVAAYHYNDNVTFKGRVSYSGNTASEASWTNAIFGGKHKNCVWLGGAVEIGF
ncbi:MAG: hypothetical protein LBF26_00640 [Puniceicoccales bacterium]|nr:hypothetical protein [Puniceicoccales bacterium]